MLKIIIYPESLINTISSTHFWRKKVMVSAENTQWPLPTGNYCFLKRSASAEDLDRIVNKNILSI